MSFVKKAVKKVFKVVKKIVKSKIFKIVAIAALIFFTAGVAAGGFAAFAGVNTVGGFMVAAGQTIATGAAAITGGLGMAGTSGALAAHGGAAATAAGLAGAPLGTALVGTVANTAGVLAAGEGLTAASLSTSSLAGLGGSTVTGGVALGTSAAQAAATASGGGGFLSAAANIFSKPILGDVTFGQLATSAITTGLGTILKSEMDQRDNPNTFVAGGLARGSGDDRVPGLSGYDFGEPEGATETAIDAPVDTLAGQLARAPEEEAPAQPQAGDGIRARLEQRGLLGQPQEEQVAQANPLAPPAPGQQQAQQGLVSPDGSQPFQQQATQIAYNPTTSIEDRLFGGLAGV